MNFEDVAGAVLRTLNPATPQVQRAADFQLCEQVKQSAECCAIGLQLAAAHRPPVVRHFALHCIEYFVKHEWNRLKASDKAALKEALFNILENEQSTLLQTDSFLTDAFAKAICEIAKREWPQNWPAFLPESLALAARGPIQLETVLKLLLRLSDDVIVLQCVAQPQRRRDIRQALDEAMIALLDFFESTLVRHYGAFEQLPSAAAAERDAHVRLCDATLTCLASYFEWVTIGKLNERIALHADRNESAPSGLIAHLFALLRSDNTRLRMATCELLLAVASKCGASKCLNERAPFLQCALSQYSLDTVAFAADRAARVAAADVREYAFFKRLAQLVSTVGSTLIAVVPTTAGTAPNAPVPLSQPSRRARGAKVTSTGAPAAPVTVEWSAALPRLVDVAYAFFMFPAHTVAESLVPFWAALFRHPALARDPLVVERVLPNVLDTLRSALLKVGFPSTIARSATSNDQSGRNASTAPNGVAHADSPSSKRAIQIANGANSRAAFALLDFDNDESFALFLSAFRNSLADLVHSLAQAHPTTTFRFACQWLAELLASPIDRTSVAHVLSHRPNNSAGSENSNGNELEICTMHSVSYIDWDALAFFCDACMLRVFNLKTCEFLLSSAELADGANALRAALAFETPRDPLVAWCVTTVRSGLSPFVKADPTLVLPLLTSLLATVRFDLPGQNRLTRFKSVKTLRQQTCQALIKLTKMHADLLFPVFEKFSEHCVELITCDENLLELERVNLLEAVIILSNSLRNYAAQEQFLLKVTEHGCGMWLTEPVQRALSSTPTFIDYYGLDRAPPDPITDSSTSGRPQFDEFGVRRLSLLFAVNSLLAAVRRSEMPAEPNARRLGGFECTLPCGAHVTRNPALTTFRRVAVSFFACLRNVNALRNPVSRQRVADAYRDGLFAIPAYEKAFILGTVSNVPTRNVNTAERKSAGERMLHFFYVLHENCIQVLSCCFAHLGHDFYHTDALCTHLACDVLFEPEHFDDYYLRPFVRSVLRSLLANCTLCTSLRRTDDSDSPPASTVVEPVALSFFDEQLFPFLARLFTHLLARFSPRWEQLANKMREREMGVLSELERRSESDSQSDDSAKRERILALRKYGVDADADEQLNEAEIIDEQLLRLVSRELLAAVTTLFAPLPNTANASSQPDTNVSSSNASVHTTAAPGSTRVASSTMDVESRSSDDEDDATGGTSGGAQPSGATNKWLFSDVARYAIRHNELRQAVLECLLASAGWCDTVACAKAAQCTVALLRLLADGGLLTEDLARAFLIFALNGIAINGHDESCKLQLITAALNVYEQRAQFPILLDVLRQIPNTTLDLLNQFDSLFAKTDPPRPASDKHKRELLRRVVEPIVKQSLSTRFSDRDVRILDLPPVFRPSKRALWRLANRRTPDVNADGGDQEDSQLGLGSLFSGD